MKPFEERYTAWIDGKLAGAELAAFEKELDDHPEAQEDKREAERLGNLLRRYASAPALTNADFFNNQLMARVAAEERRPARREPFAWPLPHLAWAGICCLLVAFAFSKAVLPFAAPPHPGTQMADVVTPMPDPVGSGPYNVQVLDAESSDPNVSVSTVQSSEDHVTVLWVEGLDYVPAAYRLE